MPKPKLIESPIKMWQLFKSYEKDTKNRPFEVQDFVGKDGDEVYRRKERCLTMEGFELFVFEQGLNTELSHYFTNRENRYSEYVTVCSRIRLAIRRDQIEGGMAGIYNPSITQRLNGLVEKSAVQVTEQQLFPDVKPDNNNA